MEFGNSHVKTLIEHTSPILLIGQFSDNDPDHFYTLSTDSQFKEWIIPENFRQNYYKDFIVKSEIKLQKKVYKKESTMHTKKLTPTKELETSYLLRPSNEFLEEIGYNNKTSKCKNKKYNEKIITSTTTNKNLIITGYEDGLVLVWEKEMRRVVPKNMTLSCKPLQDIYVKWTRYTKSAQTDKMHKSFSSKDLHVLWDTYNDYIDGDALKTEMDRLSNPHIRRKYIAMSTFYIFKDDAYVKLENSNFIQKFCKVLTDEVPGENDKKFDIKCYFNIMSLKYVFVQQNESISDLFCYEYTKNNELYKVLISSSIDGVVKIYNLDNGEYLYTLNIDGGYPRFSCCINFMKENPNNRRKKLKTSQVNLLTNTTNIINIDLISGEDPYFNNFTFKWTDINKILNFNNQFYLLGNEGKIIILDEFFNLKDEIFYFRPVSILDMIPFRKLFIFLTSRLEMSLCDIDIENTKKVKELFHIKVGAQKITNLYFLDEILYLTSNDKNTYCINVADEYELYLNRKYMAEEEKLSDKYNIFLESKKNKKKKKKGKGKKKGGSPNKKGKSKKK